MQLLYQSAPVYCIKDLVHYTINFDGERKSKLFKTVMLFENKTTYSKSYKTFIDAYNEWEKECQDIHNIYLKDPVSSVAYTYYIKNALHDWTKNKFNLD